MTRPTWLSTARLKWIFLRAHSQLFVAGGLLFMVGVFPDYFGKAARDQVLGLAMLAIGNWIRHVGPTIRRHRERGGMRQEDELHSGPS